MSKLLKTLASEDSIHTVQTDGSGFTIIRKPGQRLAFNALIRDALNENGNAFVVFPTLDGRSSSDYERAHIISFD